MALTKVSTGMLSADVASIDLNIDANTMYIDVSNNRVGINNAAPSTALDVTGSVTASGPIVLTAGALAAAGNAGLSHRSTDNKVYLQAGTGGFNILDDQQNTHFNIDSAGVSSFYNNVGIGTSLPADYADGGDNFVIYKAGDAGMSIVSSATGQGGIYFADGTSAADTTRGRIRYNHADNSMGFRVNNSEAAVIDASGNLGLGTSLPAAPLDIKLAGTVTADIFKFQRSDGAVAGVLNYNGTDGAISLGTTTAHPLAFDTNNVERMRITSGGATQIVGNGTDNDSYPLTFTNGAVAIARDNNDLKLHGYSNIVFGVSNTSYPASTERMRIDASGHAIIPAGVTLGTAVGVYNAANTLDYYEEGTWTPAVSTSVGTIGTVSGQTGTYTRIGKQVTLWWNFNITDIGTGSGDVIISNASKPFSHDSSINYPIGLSRPRSGTSSICELDTSGGIYMYGSTTGVSFYTGTITYNVA